MVHARDLRRALFECYQLRKDLGGKYTPPYELPNDYVARYFFYYVTVGIPMLEAYGEVMNNIVHYRKLLQTQGDP